ncbi:hypothetical protein RchiOBHm_Chr5g0039741 [Rosa chinensis]|uniref:Uncharacterized protein n=1 Tax=Rosa chinensis TaxID=74649 RepID=A0A2P6QCD0_ROSCH|nr:hypothetical protein RchiOBHm_Chr5g0039741 [Rosa chinensis]
MKTSLDKNKCKCVFPSINCFVEAPALPSPSPTLIQFQSSSPPSIHFDYGLLGIVQDHRRKKRKKCRGKEE